MLGALVIGTRAAAIAELRGVRPARGHRPADRAGGRERQPVPAREGRARGSGTRADRGRRHAGDPRGAQLEPPLQQILELPSSRRPAASRAATPRRCCSGSPPTARSASSLPAGSMPRTSRPSVSRRGQGASGRALAARRPIVVADAAAFVAGSPPGRNPEYEENEGRSRSCSAAGSGRSCPCRWSSRTKTTAGSRSITAEPREFSDEEIQLADERGRPGGAGHRERAPARPGRAGGGLRRAQPPGARAARLGDPVPLQHHPLRGSGRPHARLGRGHGRDRAPARAARDGPGGPARDAPAHLPAQPARPREGQPGGRPADAAGRRGGARAA